MFHFTGCRARGLWIDPSGTAVSGGGFPHSEIHGSKRVGRSPWLIAASRVLRRLAMPRHPPHARQRLSESTLRSVSGTGLRFGARCGIHLVCGKIASPVKEQKGVETCHCARGGGMVGVTGVGPVTSSLSGTRSNQLSYTPGWWRQPGSDRRLPACKAGALPAELCPLGGAPAQGRGGRGRASGAADFEAPRAVGPRVSRTAPRGGRGVRLAGRRLMSWCRGPRVRAPGGGGPRGPCREQGRRRLAARRS